MSSGAGEEELLLRPGGTVFPTDWSTDGRFIIYQATDPGTRVDLWALPLDGDRKPLALVHTAFSESNGRLSPDARWLAYASGESGRSEIYVRPFEGPGGSRLISTNGGVQPVWRDDGKELFYLSPERSVMSVSVDSDESAFQPGIPRALFHEPVIVVDPYGVSYAVSGDGQRFLINTVLPEASAPIQVVVNWKPEKPTEGDPRRP
jgi:dipeptidyl aminopeptidase/acylaminoacyl peptidase